LAASNRKAGGASFVPAKNVGCQKSLAVNRYRLNQSFFSQTVYVSSRGLSEKKFRAAWLYQTMFEQKTEIGKNM
jgi:hypothetical protein